MDDRDLDRGLDLAAQLDELLEEEDGDDGLGGDDGPDGGRVDGVLSSPTIGMEEEVSTLAGEDDDGGQKTAFAKGYWKSF